MVTFREMEVFLAVADLGTYEKAARSLGTTQSNISRHIDSFEGSFDKPLFDRSSRAARLSVRGHETVPLVRAILNQRSTLAGRFTHPDLAASTLRLGVTELMALTWLGRFLAQLRQLHRHIHVEPEVGSSTRLHRLLRDGQLDMAIVLDAERSTDMARLPVGSAQFGWYCAVGQPLPEALSLIDFEQQTVLLQGDVQQGGSAVAHWLREHQVQVRHTIHCDSVMALAGICAAGLGVACLPRAVAHEPVRNGALREFSIPLGSPEMDYVALVRIDALSDPYHSIASLAQSCSDFQTPFRGL